MVIDEEQAPENVKVRKDGWIADVHAVDIADVASQRSVRNGRGFVAGERSQESEHLCSVALDAVHTVCAVFEDGIEIAAWQETGLCRWDIEGKCLIT